MLKHAACHTVAVLVQALGKSNAGKSGAGKTKIVGLTATDKTKVAGKVQATFGGPPGVTAALPAAKNGGAGNLKRSYKLNVSVTGSGSQTSEGSGNQTTRIRLTSPLRSSSFRLRGDSQIPPCHVISGTR